MPRTLILTSSDNYQEPLEARKKRVLRSSKSKNTGPQIHEDQSENLQSREIPPQDKKRIITSESSPKSTQKPQGKPKSVIEGSQLPRVALSPAKVNGAHISTRNHSSKLHQSLLLPDLIMSRLQSDPACYSQNSATSRCSSESSLCAGDTSTQDIEKPSHAEINTWQRPLGIQLCSPTFCSQFRAGTIDRQRCGANTNQRLHQRWHCFSIQPMSLHQWSSWNGKKCSRC